MHFLGKCGKIGQIYDANLLVVKILVDIYVVDGKYSTDFRVYFFMISVHKGRYFVQGPILVCQSNYKLSLFYFAHFLS